MEVRTQQEVSTGIKIAIPAKRERRRHRRINLAQPVRLRPSEFKEDDFEEVSATVNVSREGLYFVTSRNSYETGLRLFVTVPYSGVPNNQADMEYLGQVVRIDKLPDELFGVAVHLLTPIKFKG